MNDIFGLVFLFVLVLLNGFFVAAEFALVSVRRTRIDQLVEEGHNTAKVTQKALKNLDLYIAATQLGITMASLGIGFIAEPAVEHLIEPLLGHQQISEAQIKTISFGTAFLISTVLHIVFGELAPKSWALQRSEQVALIVTRPLMIFTLIFRWLIVGLNELGNGVVRVFGLQPAQGHHLAHSEEEIRMIVGASSQEGVLEDRDRDLLYNVFDLADTTVREIMTPRLDMQLIESHATLKDLLLCNAECGYSRVPVYENDSDHIIGVAHINDILGHLDQVDVMPINDIMRPVFFVPETMKIKDLLGKFRERKSHMSIVVDEFGGTSGLVTLEDALEELVGEIYDETDDEEQSNVQVLSKDIYLMSGSLIISEAEEHLNAKLNQESAEYDTLSGFLIQNFGDIPKMNDSLEYSGWKFIVTQGDERRIQWIRVEKADLPLFDNHLDQPVGNTEKLTDKVEELL